MGRPVRIGGWSDWINRYNLAGLDTCGIRLGRLQKTGIELVTCEEGLGKTVTSRQVNDGSVPSVADKSACHAQNSRQIPLNAVGLGAELSADQSYRHRFVPHLDGRESATYARNAMADGTHVAPAVPSLPDLPIILVYGLKFSFGH